MAGPSCSDGPWVMIQSLSEMEGLQLWEGSGHPSWRNDRCGWPSHLWPLWVCIFLTHVLFAQCLTVLSSVGHWGDSRGQGRSTAGKRLARAHSGILREWGTHGRAQNAKEGETWMDSKSDKMYNLTRNQSQATVFYLWNWKRSFIIENYQGVQKRHSFMHWQQHKFDFDNEIQKPTFKSQPMW